MAITYYNPDPNIKFRVPVLHTVTVPREKYKNQWHKMEAWCAEHCQAKFYPTPEWYDEVGYEFEDDQDAVMFALKFVNG